MTILASNVEVVKGQEIRVTEENLIVELQDGRTISAPLAGIYDYGMEQWMKDKIGVLSEMG